jgi:putative hemolysin
VELEEQGQSGAHALLALRNMPERFLATVQIGITAISVAAGVFGGATLTERVTPYIAMLPGIDRYAPPVATVLVVGSITALSIILGELVPKSLALRYGEDYALFISRPLRGLSWLATPMVWFLTQASNLVLRLFGDSTSFSEVRLSREELQQLVDEAATAGSVDSHAGEIATRALGFDELDATDVMVPASDIRSLPVTAGLAELAELARGVGHARVLVYEGLQDNLLGFVNVRDALAAGVKSPPLDLRAHLHHIPYVPETMKAPMVLKELQTKRCHLAVVVDENGGIRGLVTVEDLLEELVGEIFSENDAPRQAIRKEADGSVIVQGGVAVHEVNREHGLELTEGESFSTVAGLCIHLAGRIPASGDVVETEDGWKLTIVDASPRRIRLVRISRPTDLTA